MDEKGISKGKEIQRLISALLMETSQEWETNRVYVRLDEINVTAA